MPVVRRSKKREAILRRLQETDCHPTADWVFRELREEYPDLSLGTVYRNLNQLCDEGLVKRIGVVRGQERFDACMDAHAHFVCTCCGKVIDLPDASPGPSYLRANSQLHEFSVSDCELQLKGTCKTCQQ